MSDGLVAERFRITGLLGTGGTASVFDAEDTRDRRRVALKLLHPHLAVERAVWDAFFEEVRAAQSIVHPGVAEIYDAGVHEADAPVVWIAMERVGGVSLAEHVRAHGPLAPVEAAVLAAAVLDALAAAHDGAVVHRDITPANVMLDPRLLARPSRSAGRDAAGGGAGGGAGSGAGSGAGGGATGGAAAGFDAAAFGRSIRLLDFGLADIPGRSTVGGDALLGGTGQSEGVVASVPFASPEQLSGAAVGEASDLYQVGGTLYFALTGRAPFTGDTRAIIRGHLSAPPPVPSAARPGVPRALDRVVATAMLKRPDDRYRRAEVMRDAVEAAIARAETATPAAAPATTPRARDAADATGVTRVYRTSGPTTGDEAPSPADGGSPRRSPDQTTSSGDSGWQAWAIGAVVVAVVAVSVVWSAATASSSGPMPTRSATPSAVVVPQAEGESAPTAVSIAPLATVPQIAGMPLIEARGVLERAGLVLGEVTTEQSAAVADTVLAATPAVGEAVSVPAAVAVRVASGDNVVPPVAGLDPGEAIAVLTAAGFLSHVSDSAVGSAAIVSSSTPVAGSVARVGSTVILTVPRVAASTPSPSPSTPAPLPEPSPVSTTTQAPG